MVTLFIVNCRAPGYPPDTEPLEYACWYTARDALVNLLVGASRRFSGRDAETFKRELEDISRIDSPELPETVRMPDGWIYYMDRIDV